MSNSHNTCVLQGKSQTQSHMKNGGLVDALVGATDGFGLIAAIDMDGKIAHANEAFARLSKYDPEELIGRHHGIFNASFAGNRSLRPISKAIAQDGMWRGEICSHARDGTVFWVDAHIKPWMAKSGKALGYIALAVDISDKKELELLLRQRADVLQGVADHLPGGIAVFDTDCRLLFHNDELLSLLGCPKGRRADLGDLFSSNVKGGAYKEVDVFELVRENLTLARGRKPYAFERTRPNGMTLAMRGEPLRGGGFLAMYMDVTEHKRKKAAEAQMANYDALTQMPNRALLMDRLSIACARAERGEYTAVHYVDLDRFKSINDTLGHPLGDNLLKAAAQRLKSCIRASDTVARLGGDEFVIVQTAIKSGADARVLAERVLARLSEPFHISTKSIQCGASIGIALAPQDGSEAVELIRNADLALYRAKSNGRGIYRFFEESMDSQVRAQRALELDLAKAIELNELSIVYQPIVDLRSGAVTSCEALLRWNHRDKGAIRTDQLIAIAEATGLIRPIGEWVLKNACREAATWSEPAQVAVNVSSCQFGSADLDALVSDALKESGLPPNRLVIEITETAYFQRSPLTLETLMRLRARGVQIALDDFGSGYSSLSYLHSLPIDRLKIDRSFISELSSRERAVPILRAIIGLGRDLGVATVAEGVETREQLEHLTSEGCTHAQGYLFSRPRPGAVIEHELKRSHAALLGTPQMR